MKSRNPSVSANAEPAPLAGEPERVISSRSRPVRPSSVSLTRASSAFYGIAATGSYRKLDSLRDAPPGGEAFNLPLRGRGTAAAVEEGRYGRERCVISSRSRPEGKLLALSLGFAPPLCYHKAIHLRKGKCTVEKLSQQMMQSVCVGVLAPLVVVGAVGKLPQRPPAFSGQDSSVTVHLTDRDDMALDAYLQRVLLGEMPVSFEPEALKAQAVAARTYTVKHREKHNGKLCTDSTCCQAFCEDGVFAAFSEEDRERAAAALRETDGLVLTYEGALIDATFFSCSGGRTEDALAVWGTDVPYLCSVASPGEEAAQYDRDSVTFSREALEAALDISLGEDKGSWVGAATFTEGGGVEAMELGGQRFTGVYLRKALGLRSTAFTVTVEEGGLRFDTRGYGHRVGLSQYGANAMASHGADFQTILSHYYPGTILLNYGESVEK